MNFRKQINEAEILDWLEGGDWSLPPLRVEDVEVARNTKKNAGTSADAIVSFSWRGRRFRFGAEVRRLWTPKAVAEAADQILRNAPTQGLSPLIVVPYLGGERLQELEARGVSGIDLCGNGVLVVPGNLLVFRSGSPNRFRWEGGIKNVYRGASSVAARMFLLKREFPSVGDALDEIRARGGEITLPTVSKVCKSLEDDLVIERGRAEGTSARRLRLLQPDKLLDLLRDNYAPPEITRTFTGKFSGPQEALTRRLLEWQKEGGRKAALTGASSIELYAVMAREPAQTFYCSDAAHLKTALGAEFTETERFANLRLLETKESFVYFDRREGLAASPVQTYLELATGEKREKETADQVRRLLLSRPSAKELKGRSSWTS